MGELLINLYLWIKAFHIISVICWMAGLLYLPRLFVNHAMCQLTSSSTSEVFKGMEERLIRIIMTPAMIGTWLFGLMLLSIPGSIDWSAYFAWIKAAMVLGLTFYHFWLSRVRKEFAADRNLRSPRTYRLMNEVPTLLMVVIVIMIIVRPF